MRTDTKRALERMKAADLTCAVCCGETIYESRLRGVRPLLDWLDNGVDFGDFCAADKVVGAGAAYLYVLLGVTELYAGIISRDAQIVLTRYEISVHFGECVPYIVNRTGDGRCPIEQAVTDAADPHDALARIRRRLAEMKK